MGKFLEFVIFWEWWRLTFLAINTSRRSDLWFWPQLVLLWICMQRHCGYTYRAYHLKLRNCIRAAFIKSNLTFYSFIICDLVLVYGHLLVQLPHQTIFPPLATFLNVLVVALVFLAYTVSANFRCTDLSYKKCCKLSLIGIFMSLLRLPRFYSGQLSL